MTDAKAKDAIKEFLHLFRHFYVLDKIFARKTLSRFKCSVCGEKKYVDTKDYMVTPYGVPLSKGGYRD